MTTEQLYKRYGKEIFNLAWRYLRSTADAEEVVQDVFVAIHFKREHFRMESEWGTYLYKITVNKSLDRLRSRERRRKWMSWVPWKYHLDETGFQTDETLDWAEAQSVWLLNSIATLPNQQRTAIILMKLEGKSQLESAEIMGISAKAVESLVQRAKASLIKKSKEFEGF